MKDKFSPPSSAGQKKRPGAKPRAAAAPQGKPRFAGAAKPREERAAADKPFARKKNFAAARGAAEERPRRGREAPASEAFGEKRRFGAKPRPPEEADKAERIAKRLARAGVASRREAEMMIAAGRIAVNGRVLETPAFNVRRGDAITIDGAALPAKERTRLWLYHKPAGLLTAARDDRGRATVFDSLPAALPRVVSVGRLDMNTEGLLLLTNDGGLARILELPSTGWVRHYRVRVHGKVSQQQLDSLKTGIAIDGVFYGGAEAVLEREQGSNAWISISLREGKNREIKNILGALGLSVARLIRTSFGPFRLGDLASGMVLEVRGRALRDQLGEKLAQEAELDFDAPILTPFPNAPVATRAAHAPRFADKDFERGKVARRGGAPEAEGGEAEEEEGWVSSSRGQRVMRAEPAPMPRRAQRGANVWHAPGSKARGVKREEEQEERRFARRRQEERDARREGRPNFDRSGKARRFSGEGNEGRGFAPRGENTRGFSREDGARERSFDGARRGFGAKPGGFKLRGGKPYADGGKPRADDGKAFAGGKPRTDGGKPREYHAGGKPPAGGKPYANGKPPAGKSKHSAFKPKNFKPRSGG